MDTSLYVQTCLPDEGSDEELELVEGGSAVCSCEKNSCASFWIV